MKKMWVYDPQSGGNKIPEKNRWAIQQQVETFVKTRPWSSE